MSDKDVFLIGAGFIGWTVLDLLVKDGYSVTALCRRKEHGDQVLATGAKKIVYGSLSDHELIASTVAAHTVIFHTATADDVPSVEAVLDGINRRISKGKVDTIYIHTSGTSVLDDRSYCEFKGEKIYTDKDPGPINALPDDAPHRPIDLRIVKAQDAFGDRAKIAIMIPPEIYGFNFNKRLTIQIPTLTRFALKHGYAGYVGNGSAIESQIHVDDLSRGYLVLLEYLQNNGPEATLQNPYFFCENGKEFSWLEVAQEIGKGLHAVGRIKDPEPRSIDPANFDDLFGEDTYAVVGLNSRSRAERLRQLGWEPKAKGIWESYHQDELPAILAQNE